jgi:tetratricopeptide (TPR) repeat protein
MAVLVLAAGAHAEDSSDAGFEAQIRRAFELHQRQDYAGAIPILKHGHQLHPHDYFVNLLLGVDLLRTGQRTEAIPYLEEASRLHPKEDIPLGYLGEARAGLRHYADAAIAYMRAIEVAPDSSDAAVAFGDFSVSRFGQLAEQLRRTRKGLAAEYRLRALARPLRDPSLRENLERAASLDPEAQGIWSDLALADLAVGSPTAQANLEQALEHNPDDQRAWLAEAWVAARSGDWNRAELRLNAIARRSAVALAEFMAEWPGPLQPQGKGMTGAADRFLACAGRRPRCSSEVLLRQIPPAEKPTERSLSRLFREQRWEASLALPKPALADAEAWFYRGAALAFTNRCDAAIPALERGLSNAPTSVEASFLLSRCYARQAGAMADLLARKGGGDASVHMMRGDVLLRLQANAEAAIVEYQAALKSSSGDPAAWERLSQAQMAAGQTEAARASAFRALQIDSHRTGAVRVLAKIAMQDRDYTTALPYLRQLVKQDPEDASTRVELATASAQTGEMEEALRNLQPVLGAGYPDEKGSLHYLLGTILRKMGRSAEATQAFHTAGELSDAYQQSSHREGDKNE